MEVSAVKKQIKDKDIQNRLYLFTGDEIMLQNMYIAQMSKVSKLPVVRADSVSVIYSKLTNKTLFDTNAIYVIRDDSEFAKTEKLWDKLEHMDTGNVVILLYTTIDKRGKMFKHFKDKIVVFEYMNETVLTKYIKKKMDISDSMCKKLIDVCEKDYSRICLELDKVKTFAELSDLNDEFSIKTLFKEHLIYEPPVDAIFDLVDCVLHHSCKEAYRCLEECKAIGEHPLVVLTVLYNNVKALLLVQCCKGNNISQTTGLNSWQIHQVSDSVNVYSSTHLLYMLQKIQSIEEGIKIGRIPENIAIDYLFTCIL